MDRLRRQGLAEYGRLARNATIGRNSPRWQGWETRESYKYAIAKNGRLYPPKEIIALATGTPNSHFSGGAEANGYLRKLGFRVEALRLLTEGQAQAALHDLLVTAQRLLFFAPHHVVDCGHAGGE